MRYLSTKSEDIKPQSVIHHTARTNSHVIHLPYNTRQMTVPRPLSSIGIASLGAVLALTHTAHIFTHDKPPVAMLIGAGIPLTIALLIIYAGYWTKQQHYPAQYSTQILKWTVLGGIAIGGLIGIITTHQYLAGDIPHDAGYQLATAISGGALAGFVAGTYNTESHRRLTRFKALQETTTTLITASQKKSVCEHCVQFIETELNASLTGAWLYNASRNTLEPAAATTDATDTFDTHPTYTPGNSLSWNAFTDGEVQIYNTVHEHPDRYNPDTVIQSEIIIPLGSHGVLNIGSREPGAFDDVDVTTARILASITENVLDRIERETELQEQREELEQQNDRLEEFASIVSHDLRNPLNVANGYLELAKEDCQSDALKHIETAHNRMETLITDMLHLAQAGQTIEETTRIPVGDTAEAAWEMVDTPSSAELTVTPRTTDYTVISDESRLRQLFENLFRNAVEHGGGDVTVTVGVLDTDSKTGFYVADDGPGIPVEDRDRVFESGYTTNENGSGLGLVTVQRIVDAHGWGVTVTRSTNGGARFEIDTDPEHGEQEHGTTT